MHTSGVKEGEGRGEAHVQTMKKNRHWQQLAWQSFLITWANKVGFLAWLTTKEFIFGLESRMVLITDSSNYVLLVLIRRFASSSKYHLITKQDGSKVHWTPGGSQAGIWQFAADDAKVSGSCCFGFMGAALASWSVKAPEAATVSRAFSGCLRNNGTQSSLGMRVT